MTGHNVIDAQEIGQNVLPFNTHNGRISININSNSITVGNE